MTTPPDLDVTFYDYLQPAASAGVYTIRVRQVLTRNGVPVDTADPLPVAEDRYEVRGAQFFLDPTTVHATYPPAGSAGHYTHVLPHITFNRALLPWERQLPGRTAEAHEPWLALLVFAAGEVDDDPSAQGEFTRRTVRALREPGERGTVGPVLTGPVDEDSECRTIDVPAEVFTAVVPRQNELFYLAHMRDVRTPSRHRGEVPTEGRYGVLAANRFPRAPGAYAAHLVSLQGHLDHLTTLPPGTQRVRLCSLWSWAFTNDPDGHVNPGELLRHLAAPDPDDPENLALRLTPATTVADTVADTPEQRYARTRLRNGYAPVAYRALSGEDTYAWYRGPFTPLTAPPVPAPATPGPHTTADHALIYDREHGLFDVSYASAWTLGRTIALADPDYTGELTAARRELSNRAATLAALATDTARAANDPDALPGAAALRDLATDTFRGLVQALQAPLVQAPPSPPQVRTARPDLPALLADPRVRQSLSTVADARTPTLPQWLERLGLLHGVPFDHLVPDIRMLPPESMRAFRIDPDWIAALVAGATDVGAHTSVDRDLNPLLCERLGRARSTELPVAGLLIRSALVPAWPDFDLLATCGPGAEPVSELRRDHLGPDVLLLLWDAVPDKVVIREPGQGIHFGINGEQRISLRNLTGPDLGYDAGTEFPAPGTSDVFSAHLRPGRAGAQPDVLNLRGAGGLVPALAAFLGLPDLSPSQFALELVNAPLEQRLLPPGSTF
ncbi:hypothetical protein ACFVXG_22270 [Kitasatospora sp. NPDC058162]|uniref:hypothetical protein n=1 Tax=Kitasatospora sp. NPDC058162 TaxID=3346362 RepID=UPI0036D8E270